MTSTESSGSPESDPYFVLKQKLLRNGVAAALGAYDEKLTLEDLFGNSSLYESVVGPVMDGLLSDYGLQYDSLDMLEALAPGDEGPKREGPSGVREPRPPVRPSDVGGIALERPSTDINRESSPKPTAAFTLAEVLSVVSGVTFLDPDDYDLSDPTPVTRRISEVLTFVTQSSEPLEIYKLQRAADMVSSSIIAQNPILSEILATCPEPGTDSPLDTKDWYALIKETYDLNQEIELTPADPAAYTHMSRADEIRYIEQSILPNSN